MRLSRGRSTPTRRAMWRFPYGCSQRFRACRVPASCVPGSGHLLRRRLRSSYDGLAITLLLFSCGRARLHLTGSRRARSGLASSAEGLAQSAAETPRAPSSRVASALTLLVARVVADHHDAAVATDHLALVTDRLDARVDLYERPFGLAGLVLVPVDGPPPGQVVGRELHDHPVLREDPDVVLPHLAADVGEDLVPVAQLDPEHRVRESLHNGALDFDHAFFLRHVLRNLCSALM